jgi:hypothetical protein
MYAGLVLVERRFMVIGAERWPISTNIFGAVWSLHLNFWGVIRLAFTRFQ